MLDYSRKPSQEKFYQALTRYGVPVSFKAKEPIYQKGTPSDSLYYIINGKVKNFIDDENGSEVIFTLFRDNSIIGEVAAFNGWDNICSAEALVETYAVRVSPQKIRELFFVDPQVAYFLMEHISKKLVQASGQSFALTCHQVPTRLARILLTLELYGIEAQGRQKWYYVTHEELSGIVGTTRPNITNMLKTYAAKGLIETKRGRLRILEREKLNDYYQNKENSNEEI